MNIWRRGLSSPPANDHPGDSPFLLALKRRPNNVGAMLTHLIRPTPLVLLEAIFYIPISYAYLKRREFNGVNSCIYSFAEAISQHLTSPLLRGL